MTENNLHIYPGELFSVVGLRGSKKDEMYGHVVVL
jgi:hypothetical protein